MVQPLSPADLESRLIASRRLIAEKWGWFLALGIALIVVGLAAIVFPLLTGAITAIFLGWLFLIGGVLMIVHAFSAQGWQGFLWSLLVGILYLVAGGYLVVSPLTSLLTLTLLLIILFAVEGVFEVIMAFRVRPHEGWGFMLLSGIAALAVALLIAFGLPGSAAWALGLLVGINLLFSGWSYVFLALAGRRAHEGASMAAA
jgi:uncharacterized membrane protein HdeD (DUF308 family)